MTAMSIEVDLADLAAAVDEGSFAYLVTTGDDERPRVIAVATTCRGAEITTSAAGRSAAANVARRPDLTLVYPPAQPGGMSLLVDGRGRVDGAAVVVTAQHAVWHRAAPPSVD